MMSRISGNQTNNNSEQPNASISGVSMTATDLASAVVLNKQRKKRKKKRDKISLTNEAVNCGCGKRIESNFNSVSTCSNCVPSTCIYCHFNDLANRENYFTEHSSHFEGNFYDQNIKTESPQHIWQTKIESNDIASETHDDCNYFKRQQRNNGLNRRAEQLQRFAVYENLCEFCGFAIGNGAYHLHCDANKQTIQTLQNEQKPENIYENICESCHTLYDGEQCMSETCKRNTNATIFESVSIAGEVIDVLVKKPPIANRQFGKQFSEFLGSFKQKLTSKCSETERKKPKIEIIHNTDQVFKTNKTFDLNEIVQLKNQSLLTAQKANTCSELINGSNEIVTELPSKPIRLLRTSNSDSNFFENYHLSAPRSQTPYTESIVSDTILYSNSYAPPSYEDAIQHSKYASVTPFKLRARIKPKLYDSTSASSFFTYNSSSVSTLQSHSLAETERKSPTLLSLFDNDDSIKQWLQSIQHQTHDYAENKRQFECGSIKCVPSKMLNESVTNLKWSIEYDDNINCSNTINDRQVNLLRRIELFKENLMEHKMHSKRNAIYIKDSMSENSIDVALSPDTIAPDIGTTNVQPSSCLQLCYGNGSDNSENNDGIVCLRPKNQLTQYAPESTEKLLVTILHEQRINHDVALETTSQYLQILKAFYMAQVTMSTSLNRITLVCGDRRIHFFVKFLLSQPQNQLQCTGKLVKLVQPSKYTNFQQIIEQIHKMNATKQLGEHDNDKSLQLGISRISRGTNRNCLMRSANLVLRTPLRSRHKRTIEDFVKRKHRNAFIAPDTVKTLDDYSKPCKDSDSLCKSLNDFAKKKTDYSPTATDTVCNINMQNEDGNKMKKNECAQRNDESIYQAIWMFKTIGAAAEKIYDEDSLNEFNTCKNESDAITVNDGSDWEVAEEEFLFSNQRIDTTHPNTTQSISHAADVVKIQLPKMDATQRLDEKRPYHTICVLYSTVDPKLKKIIYDYNGNSTEFTAIDNKHNMNEDSTCNRVINENRPHDVIKRPHNLCNSEKIAIKLDSVNAWKNMLRTIDYIEDEEDVILSESYLLNQKSAEYNNQNNVNIQSVQSDDSGSDTTKSSNHHEKTEETDLSSDFSTNSSVSSASPTASIESKSKKESGFLNKLQYKRFDISNRNHSKKDDVVQGLFYKNLNGKIHAESSPPMEIKRLNQTGTMVFGVTLDEVEKDEKLTDIPKFVVECINVIEIEENMRTNGIYRASGKKDSIDKLRKRMNESKLRRGTKYVSLKDEDVHTITGALKQFFRELKTELIPDNIVQNLPNDLESESSLASIRNAISTIDYLSRETLKYLLQHLIRVDANKEYNLMNASNLSIVWGASLFTASVSITNAFETSDLLRRNTLIKVLIQRYDEIFIDTDRLI